MPNPRYGYVIATDEDGRVVWSSINDHNILPSQSGKAGLFLSTTGSGVYWDSGNAKVTVQNSTVNSTFYPTFVSATGQTDTLNITQAPYGLSFNPNSNTLSAQNVVLNTAIVGTGNTSPVGVLQWDNGEGTIKLGLKGGNATLNLGQQQVVLSYNGVGTSLTKGQVVYISGAQGQRPSFNLALANAEMTSARTFGIVDEPISAGSEGFITTFGVIRGINTSSFNEGSGLWLSSTTPGAITMTRPQAPNHGVFVGICVRSHASAGQIFVAVQNGIELDELHNVLITNPSSGQSLIYDSSNLTWQNRNLNLTNLNDVAVTAPASGQALIYDTSNNKWKNTTISTGTTYTAGSGLTLIGSQFNLAGTGILNRLTINDPSNSGVVFGINNISGLSLFEVDASGFVRLGRFGADIEVYKQLELIPTGTTSGQTNELRFFELAASGQNYVGFKAPDSLAANRVWTLPTGDGTSNQSLTTNGAGALSWSTPIPTSGTATALNTTAVSTNATFYPVLSSGTGGNFAASVDTGLTYNPSTDMLTASGITANRIVGSVNIIITESTTSRTLQAGDNGGVIMCTNTSGATITLPTSLPVGFSVGVLAAATGVVSFTTSGTTLNNRQSHTKLAGQWAMGTIIQRTTNNFVLAGDTA